MKEFTQINAADSRLLNELRQLVRLAIWEDLQNSVDLTTFSLVPEEATGSAAIVARQPGVAAGMDLLPAIIAESECNIELEVFIQDGQPFDKQQTLCQLAGKVRDLLSLERIALNFLGRLCGIASLTSRYVQLIKGTGANVYDTRKTTPGWRYLEKYAVQCGGGRNHRLGLFDAILIKDNHLAFHVDANGNRLSPSQAIEKARDFAATWPDCRNKFPIIEIEVDNLAQFHDAISQSPDIILLDNMSNDQLRQAVAIRNELKCSTQLEASGGVRFDTIAAIATTGVERISVGALTHSAINLDLGLDWLD
jgi:nicotinate-nucleotide pyrophosphorylase (carboxylating)